jgi:predicted nucleic acid-binding protein
MISKAIVLDANILIRAVLGQRVRQLILAHASDARKYLPALLKKRGASPEAALQILDLLEPIVRPMALELYASHQEAALQRIAARDADDWPVLACAMALKCPVWTEDADFFGSGIATWTTDRVALYLA